MKRFCPSLLVVLLLCLLTLTACGSSTSAAGPTATAARMLPTSAPPAEIQADIKAYQAYVLDQANHLVDSTRMFTDAVQGGDLNQARALFAPTRQYYERIEPIAESFGNLAVDMNARENDVPADQWRGFHRIEQALWEQGTTDGQGQYAQQLLSDVQQLDASIDFLNLTPSDIVNGAIELLDEASAGKITGAEDRYSHTDLSDIAANAEGARAAFEAFSNYLEQASPGLFQDVEAKFQAIETVLSPYRQGDGFMPYNALTSAQTKQLGQALDAAAESLGQIASELPQG